MKDKLKLKNEVKEFMQKYGLKDFPTKEEFRNYPEGKSLLWFVDNVLGGINDAREEMGFPIKYRCGKRSLRHRENFKKEMEAIIRNFKDFPSCRQLPDYLVVAAITYHGGIPAVRERMGFTLIKKTRKCSLIHWLNLNKEMRNIVLELKFVPLKADLERIKRYDLTCSLRRHWNNLEFSQLKKIWSGLKENDLCMEILRIIWKRKEAWIADICKQLNKEGYYKELDAKSIANAIDELDKMGLLECENGKYIARG